MSWTYWGTKEQLDRLSETWTIEQAEPGLGALFVFPGFQVLFRASSDPDFRREQKIALQFVLGEIRSGRHEWEGRPEALRQRYAEEIARLLDGLS